MMETTDSGQLGGQKLVEALVSLTGLPEAQAFEEIGHILNMSGQQVNELSIDQLRQAMMVYLEAIDFGMCCNEQGTVVTEDISTTEN